MNLALSLHSRTLPTQPRRRHAGPADARYLCFINWPVFALCGAAWGMVIGIGSGIVSLFY